MIKIFVIFRRIPQAIKPTQTFGGDIFSAGWVIVTLTYRAFAHDLTAAILVFQNNKMAAMLVFQTSPVGVELFSYVNTFFCSHKFA